MAITSKTAVETEYATRRDGIRAYSTATLDSTLAGIDALALSTQEAVELYQAREILNGRVPATDAASSSLPAQVAAIHDAVTAVRSAVTAIKAAIPD